MEPGRIIDFYYGRNEDQELNSDFNICFSNGFKLVFGNVGGESEEVDINLVEISKEEKERLKSYSNTFSSKEFWRMVLNGACR